MFIQWDKKFESGNELLDAQHKILIIRFKKLDITIKFKLSATNCSSDYLRIEEICRIPFFCEENMMYETSHP
jgi:hemerythrin